MTNKLTGIDKRPAPVSSGAPVRRTQDATVSDGKSSQGQPAGTVSITDSARQLAALEQAVKAMPNVNEARVAEIRKAIQDGRYTVDPEKIADKLMQMEQSLQVAAPKPK
jgi:negative regulator of flagellin synthesis FlgM